MYLPPRCDFVGPEGSPQGTSGRELSSKPNPQRRPLRDPREFCGSALPRARGSACADELHHPFGPARRHARLERAVHRPGHTADVHSRCAAGLATWRHVPSPAGGGREAQRLGCGCICRCSRREDGTQGDRRHGQGDWPPAPSMALFPTTTLSVRPRSPRPSTRTKRAGMPRWPRLAPTPRSWRASVSSPAARPSSRKRPRARRPHRHRRRLGPAVRPAVCPVGLASSGWWCRPAWRRGSRCACSPPRGSSSWWPCRRARRRARSFSASWRSNVYKDIRKSTGSVKY